jgi:hypothetical protein
VAVADDLVDDVGLRRVQRDGRMADVLCGMEDPVSQGAIERVEGDEAGGGDVGPSGQPTDALGDLVERRYPVARERDPPERLAILGDGVAIVLGRELAPHGPPHLLLLVAVRNRRGGLPGVPGECRRRDLAAPRPIRRVVGARMIVGEVDGHGTVGPGGHRGVELGFLEHPRQ